MKNNWSPCIWYLLIRTLTRSGRSCRSTTPATPSWSATRRRRAFSRSVYKVPYTFIFFNIPILFVLIFFPKISVTFAPLDILPNSLNTIGKMILLSLSLFSMLYSSPLPWYSLPLFTTWFSSPTYLVNPTPGGGDEELYIPLAFRGWRTRPSQRTPPHSPVKFAR